MDQPIGNATMRAWDDSPGYDLISLGLVGLVVLLIAVWLTHFFRQPAPGFEDYETRRARLFQDRNFTASDGQLTSEGYLMLAQWVDFNLRPADGESIPPQLRENLVLALRREKLERAGLKDSKSAWARAVLAENPEPPARAWAQEWVRRRSERFDRSGTSPSVRLELAKFCDELELKEEAAREREKVRTVRPDHPGLK